MMRLLDIREAAEYLRVSVSTVRRWVGAGMLKATQYQRFGKLWFYRDDLELLMERRKPVLVTDATANEFELEVSAETQANFDAFVEKFREG